MTPKQKAEELIYKMHNVDFHDLPDELAMQYVHAKQCALIAVNEIIDSINWHPLEYPNKEIIFWNEVIEEIEKL